MFARSGLCAPRRAVISEGCPCLGCHALFSVGCQKPPSFASAGAETCCEGYPPPKKQGSLSLCWGQPPLPCPTLSCPPAWFPSVPAWPRPPLPGLLDAGLRAAPSGLGQELLLPRSHSPTPKPSCCFRIVPDRILASGWPLWDLSRMLRFLPPTPNRLFLEEYLACAARSTLGGGGEPPPRTSKAQTLPWKLLCSHSPPGFCTLPEVWEAREPCFSPEPSPSPLLPSIHSPAPLGKHGGPQAPKRQPRVPS